MRRVGQQLQVWTVDSWRVAVLLLVGAFLPPSATALTPDRQITQYAHSAWRLQDGFLGSSPLSIAQTSDGYIWVGTQAGIKRFDGVQFVEWNPPGGERLRTATICALLGASDGSLWIGTADEGLWRYQHQRLSQLPLDTARNVVSIVEGEEGSVWLASLGEYDSSVVCQATSAQVHCYGVSDGLPHGCCELISKGTAGYLWITGRDQVVRWKPSSGTFGSYKTSYPVSDPTNLHSIVVTPDGDAWVGNYAKRPGAGLQHLVGGTWNSLKLAHFDSTKVGTSALFLDRHKVLWIGSTDQGLYRVREGQVDHFSNEDGLSGGLILNLFEDHEGNIWVVTSKGVDCFKDVAVATMSTREGLSTTQIDSVLASRDGTIWVGGYQGLDAIRDSGITSLRTTRGLPGLRVTSLFEDEKSRFLVGIDKTFSILKDGKFTSIKRPDGKPLGFVVGISKGLNEDTWAEISGDHRELLHLENLRVKQVLPVPEAPAARRVAVDPSGNVWLGLVTGDLARLRQGKVELFHFPHEIGSWVNDLRTDQDGSVLGATNFGLIGWHDGKQQTMTTRNGLPCDGVNTFIKDRHDALWLYMQCGLVQILDPDLRSWWRSPGGKVRLRVFDALDGVQPGFGSFEAAALGLDGQLWFANGTVLQVVDPEHLRPNTISPPVHVEELKTNGRSLDPADGLRLPALTRDLSIRYTAPSFVIPQRVFFRYVLEGQDKSWQEAGTRREAFYTNLKPGNYRFHVIACNNDGLWNEVGDSFKFTIAPAYYETRWFAVLCWLSLACLLSLLYVLRMKQAHAQLQQQLGARLEERERISRELHDTLLQGFQGLMLRFQAVLKTLPENHQGRLMLENVLDRADEVLLEGRQSVRELRIRRTDEDFASLISRCGEELAQSYAIAFSLDLVGTARALDPLVCDEAFRIGREALFNAFQHSCATKIEAEITFSHSKLRLRVRDNGTGMSTNLVEEGRSGHWGLAGMRERAKRIHSELDIWSVAGAGTELDLQVPGGVAYPRYETRPFWRRILKRSKDGGDESHG